MIAFMNICLIVPACLAQSPQSAASQAGSIVSGHPFSATKYSRLIRILPNGISQFLQNEAYPIKLARSDAGQVYLQSIESLEAPCDQLSQKVPPPCPTWDVIVFDPQSDMLTHWTEGEISSHAAVIVKMTTEQSSEVERATSNMPEEPVHVEEGGAMVTREDLGKKVIQGVSADGFRITTTHKSSQNGKAATETIHEVWRSEELRLVLKVIDGDPAGIEKISGLEKVSLHPASTLFSLPEGFQVQSPNAVGIYAKDDLAAVQSWFVMQEPISPDPAL
ncbi:hypothetical protein [Acidipila sp. EB88]|uniref:hypothetical protein n=1 Tax=Acidipila sp. EB88 TaxID=2305226 RepID=UPI000F5D6200|nr:hypothetical protein [Acidipila sp. EB88]